MKNDLRKSLLVVAGSVATILASAGLAAIIALPASATQQFATDTGKSCGACHQSATGGGALTPYGEKFKANGDKAP
jgi:hypothetical protein